jgi:glycosyltransferase involved in cell wall biosynthesis
MRILHLVHSEGVYGAELILLYLAREQQQHGHEVAVGSMRDPGTPQTEFEQLAAAWGVPVVPIRIAPRPTPGVIRALLGHVRAFRAEVLHSHGYKANILLGLLPRGVRPPMLATLHGWTSTPGLSALRLYEYLDRWAIGRLDALVVVTSGMLDLPALRTIAAAKKYVIENGIPARALRLADLKAGAAPALPRELSNFVQRRPTLIAIGRLSAEKGFALLIDAFARARVETGGLHQLLIVGEGPLRVDLARQIAALKLEDSVLLPGYVAGADRLLETAAGFVLSSSTEAMPLAVLEALQWPAPILATAVGAIPELLQQGEAGQLVPPDNLQALTEGLATLMSARAGAPVGAAAAQAHRYSSARMAEQYLRVYESIT